MGLRRFRTGDLLSRTVGGQTEAVTLPPIDMNHLRSVTVDGNKVRGFHVLAAAVYTIISTSSVTLPVGSIAIVDPTGAPLAGTRIRLMPHRVPTDGFDAFEAKVEVVDSTGIVLGSDASKSFYPQSWTEDQIQDAIYSAYAEHYLAGGSPLFFRQVLTTPTGVAIELRVSGSSSAAGVKLKGIPTAYLQSGQRLTSSHAP